MVNETEKESKGNTMNTTPTVVKGSGVMNRFLKKMYVKNIFEMKQPTRIIISLTALLASVLSLLNVISILNQAGSIAASSTSIKFISIVSALISYVCIFLNLYYSAFFLILFRYESNARLTGDARSANQPGGGDDRDEPQK